MTAGSSAGPTTLPAVVCGARGGITAPKHGRPGATMFGAYYKTREQAQRHLERWLLARPWVISLDTKRPRGTKSRRPSLPDWRLAQYLRLTDE